MGRRFNPLPQQKKGVQTECYANSAQLLTMLGTNCIKAVSDTQFWSISDITSVSNIISDTCFEFSHFVCELVPADHDGNDEDIDNVALEVIPFLFQNILL